MNAVMEEAKNEEGTTLAVFDGIVWEAHKGSPAHLRYPFLPSAESETEANIHKSEDCPEGAVDNGTS